MKHYPLPWFNIQNINKLIVSYWTYLWGRERRRRRRVKGMAMASATIRQQSVCLNVRLRGLNFHVPPQPSQYSIIPIYHNTHHSSMLCTRLHLTVVPKASARSLGPASPPTDDDGVSLGTMKLPVNIDLQRFDSLLFQVYYLHKAFNHFIFLFTYILVWSANNTIYSEFKFLINYTKLCTSDNQ